MFLPLSRVSLTCLQRCSHDPHQQQNYVLCQQASKQLNNVGPRAKVISLSLGPAFFRVQQPWCASLDESFDTQKVVVVVAVVIIIINRIKTTWQQRRFDLKFDIFLTAFEFDFFCRCCWWLLPMFIATSHCQIPWGLKSTTQKKFCIKRIQKLKPC